MPTRVSVYGYFMVSLLTSVIVLACQKATYSYQYQEPSTDANVASQILFMSFVATMRQDSVTHIEQLAFKPVAGSFKDLPVQSQLINRLEIKLLDGSKKELSSYSIDHPLFRNVEYQNTNNQLVARTVHMQRQEFFVRVMLPGNSVFVRVDEIKHNSMVGQTLFKLK